MNATNITEYTNTLGVQAKAASALMARAQAATKSIALRKLAMSADKGAVRDLSLLTD